MVSTADVVVVGGGINGASVAFSLTQLGVSNVLVLDANFPTYGASGRGDGLIRTYYANRTEAELALSSLAVYRNWSEVVGGTCEFVGNGFMWIDGPEHADDVRANVAMLRDLGAKVDLLSADQVVDFQPHLAADGIGIAAYEPDSGGASAAAATRSLLSAALRGGASLCTYVPVVELLVGSARVTGVRTAQDTIQADTVVLAAGPWSAPLLQPLGLDIPVEPVRCSTGRIFLPPLAARPANFIDNTTNTFLRVTADGLVHISVRDKHHLSAADPDEDPGPVSRDAIKLGISQIAHRVPLLAAAAAETAWWGVDGATPDNRAILGPVPEFSGLQLCVGSTFKGLKVAPAVGRAVAEYVVAGRSTTIEVGSLGLERFLTAAAPVANGDFSSITLI